MSPRLLMEWKMTHKQYDAESHRFQHRDHARLPRPYWKRAHRDWRAWLAVLMIALILVYVLIDSLAFSPGNGGGQPMPAMDAR